MTWNKEDKLFEDVVVNTLFKFVQVVAVVTLVMTCKLNRRQLSHCTYPFTHTDPLVDRLYLP